MTDSLLADTLVLDHLVDTALHQQLYRELRRVIEEGVLQAGDRLPSSRAIAKAMGVSRNTVLSSFDQLMAEGFVYSKNGAGTFVGEQELLSPKLKAYSGNDRAGKLPQINIASKLLKTPHLNTAPYSLRSNKLLPGLVDTLLFPQRQWNHLQGVHNKSIDELLPEFDLHGGYKPLQTALARHLATSRGISAQPEQIFITGGASQAVLLISKVLSDAGDQVWVENPGYPVVAGTFDLAGLEVQPIAVDQQGMNPSDAQIKNTQPRFISLTTSYQFPLGYTMPIARRKKILEIACLKNFWIVEDDYDGEYRYSGSPIPALFGLEDNQHTLYMGTFSKTLSPFLRTNFLIVPPQLVDYFRHVYPIFGNESNLQTQASLAEFINRGYFARHIRKMRKEYGERRKILQRCLREMQGNPVADSIDPTTNLSINSGTNPGGLHLKALLRGPLTDIEICEKARGQGLACQPLSSFYLPGSKAQQGLLLGYTSCDREAIIKAMTDLRGLLEKEECSLVYGYA